MNKPRLILIGAGGHAHACIDVIEQHGGYQIAGLIGMSDEVHDQHFGYAVIGTDDGLPKLVNTIPYALITLGQIKSPTQRIRLYEQAKKIGFKFPAIVSPNAYVSRHARIGAGAIVMHGAVVNAGANVGENCIINTHALIEHDAVVEDHCHVATGAILNGDVVLRSGSFVGSGSIVKQGIAIGNSCVIGMGLFVRHDLNDHSNFTDSTKS